MKVHGLLQPDGANVTNIDNRKQVLTVLANLSEEQLRALIDSGTKDAKVALPAVADNRGLSDSAAVELPSAVASSRTNP